MTAERKLAAAVLCRAISDLKYEKSRIAERREWARDARAFLAGGPVLEHWCALAGVDPEEVRRWAT